jgi:quercetin dioxygenase-like cupin family protein
MTFASEPARVITARDQGRAGSTRFLATGADTRGDFGLFEFVLRPGDRGPVPHLHHTFSESFHLLEGTLDVLANDRWITATAGDVVYVPRSSPHAYRATDVTARFLVLFTPGIAREAYFEGLVALHADGRVPTVEEIDEFARRHDQLNLR